MEAADHGKRRACESCRSVGAPENVRYVRTVSGATLLACICPEHTQQTPPLIQLQMAITSRQPVPEACKPSRPDLLYAQVCILSNAIPSGLTEPIKSSIPSHHCPDSSAMPSVEHHESSIDFGTQASASNTSHGSTPNDIPHFGMAPDILDHLIDVYRVKLHIQPLPLFNIGTLREVLANAQLYLVWSLLALVLPLSSPEFPGHPDPETVALDTQSANSTVMRMAADGIPRFDVVQSLCLLALKDVMEDSRAPSKYVCINAHYIRTLMIWTKVVSYLHEIRSGRRETPWLSDSTYAKLNVEILDFDTELYPAHRLKNGGLSGRLYTELSKEQEYWYPWLMVQIASHASLALINHPFLHLGVMPTKDGRLQLGTFLQQTVDQSLFHSGWVLRILSIFETLPFQLNDPSVGHLVAVVATVPWIFQFARHPRVSIRAREDVRKFVALLEQISSSWPHLSHKLEILQSLQATAGCQLWGIEPKNTTITFHSSKLWQLLDSNLADEFYASTFEGGDVMVDNRDPDIMLLEDRDMQQALDITSSTLPTAGALDNLPEKDCLSLFLPEDFEWLQAF
ncbi:hypothetical protein BFJ63_vAg10933 [Fusarium oxysporum f. sp. narcissi]|uniref:Transcription factor domain-containing protein n=1 Tax=Fusarium oxysporum f. sp. narcissi TaxID=451672 RepID=A0A4Q2VJA5_FUSOX|nr:hypothetical protein BFJ63_vAg10933 [Fusarium oxysporum f. sp. narcissi]